MGRFRGILQFLPSTYGILRPNYVSESDRGAGPDFCHRGIAGETRRDEMRRVYSLYVSDTRMQSPLNAPTTAYSDRKTRPSPFCSLPDNTACLGSSIPRHTISRGRFASGNRPNSPGFGICIWVSACDDEWNVVLSRAQIYLCFTLRQSRGGAT